LGNAALTDVELAIAALRSGELAVVPTDTVYGLAGRGDSPEVAHALYLAKGRSRVQPTALLFASVDTLFDRLPELPEVARAAAAALLPGSFTLVLPNPGRSYAWLSAERPETIGVRVPELGGPGREVLDAVEVLVATSANLPGGADPRRVEDVPREIVEAVSVVVDAGELPGIPSTVVDLTRGDPRILREGAVPAREALDRIAAVRDA
jgi:L-threonylcarbamoyladenylate synthase